MSVSLDMAWREQRIWSHIADGLKSRLRTGRRVALILAIMGAVSSATAAGIGLSTGPGKTFAFLSAAAVGLATVVQASAGPAAIRNWTRARSAAEAIKSEVYVTLAGFGAPDLDARIERISGAVADLRAYRACMPSQPLELPAVRDLESYFTVRVDVQIRDYYDKQAAELNRILGRFRVIGFGSAALGVLLGAAAGTWEIDGMATWVPVVTTISAAVVAYVAAERYSYLALEYVRTADELRRLRARTGEAATLTDGQLVRRAESVISMQNEGWMAKLSADHME